MSTFLRAMLSLMLLVIGRNVGTAEVLAYLEKEALRDSCVPSSQHSSASGVSEFVLDSRSKKITPLPKSLPPPGQKKFMVAVLPPFHKGIWCNDLRILPTHSGQPAGG